MNASGPSSGTSTSQSRTPAPRPDRHSPATNTASSTSMSVTKIDAYVHGVSSDSQRGARKTANAGSGYSRSVSPTGTPPNIALSWSP